MGKNSMDRTYYEDSIRSGRPDSPAVEYAFQDRLSAAIALLLESKGLYQNVRIESSFAASFSKPDALVAEFSKRPIELNSRGEAELGGSFGRAGGVPIGTPNDEMPVGCYLPNINLTCHGCNADSSFLSLRCSAQSRWNDPYPILGAETEQVFSLTYQCATCRKAVITYQLFRRGLRFQVTGRTVAFRPKLAKDWPKDITEIVTDSLVAAAENDVPAAYYHLRTAIEFHLKNALSIPIATKCEGTELCERYYITLDDRLKSGFPSVAGLHSELSAGLHSRDVSSDRFHKMFGDLLTHFKAKELFAQFTP